MSIVGIICEKLEVLCHTDGYSWRHASVYLESINFVSIRYFFSPYSTDRVLIYPCSIALYGLLIFYGLMKDELKNRRPMAKFLSIKLIVMFTFYQSFVVRFTSL